MPKIFFTRLANINQLAGEGKPSFFLNPVLMSVYRGSNRFLSQHIPTPLVSHRAFTAMVGNKLSTLN